jgi:hypothetical protein
MRKFDGVRWRASMGAWQGTPHTGACNVKQKLLVIARIVRAEVPNDIEWIGRLLVWKVIHATLFRLAWYVWGKLQAYAKSASDEDLWDAQSNLACAIMTYKEHLLYRIRDDYDWDFYEYSVRTMLVYAVQDMLVMYGDQMVDADAGYWKFVDSLAQYM